MAILAFLIIEQVAVLIQENVEAYMMGRVFSIVQVISASAITIAMFLFGPLADSVPFQWILLVSG